MTDEPQYYIQKKEDLKQLISETKHLLHFLEKELRDIEDYYEQVNK